MIRTILKNEPFEDDPATGARTSLPERGTWWELDLDTPDRDSWRFSPLPTVEVRDLGLVPLEPGRVVGPEHTVEVHWLLWGLRLWWQDWRD